LNEQHHSERAIEQLAGRAAANPLTTPDYAFSAASIGQTTSRSPPRRRPEACRNAVLDGG